MRAGKSPTPLFPTAGRRPDGKTRVRPHADPARARTESVIGFEAEFEPSQAQVDALRARGKDLLFGKGALEEAERATDISAELARRPSVKGTRVSIDKPGTQNREDALSLREGPNGTWIVGVSISDASALVRRGGPLDMAARVRAKGQYTENRLYPMLPRSHFKAMSLDAHVPRLAKTLEMHFSAEGELLGHEFFRSKMVNQYALEAESSHMVGTVPQPAHQAIDTLCRLAAELRSQREIKANTKASTRPMNPRLMVETFIEASGEILAKDLRDAGIQTTWMTQETKSSPQRLSTQPLPNVGRKAEVMVGWTSPGRDYAQLDVHRALDQLLDGRTLSPRAAEVDARMREIQIERAQLARTLDQDLMELEPTE